MTSAGRREAAAAALVAALAFLPFVRGFVSGASLYFRDLVLGFFSHRLVALDGLRSGDVRLWNPYLHEGVPLSLPALAYPVDLLQLIRPDEVGISLVLALHVPLAGLSFYALARRLLEAPPTAAVAGALVYSLGGFVLSTVNLYVYLEAAAWAPLVVLGLARVLAGGSRRTVAGSALALAVALSTTGVEIVVQAVAIGFALGIRPRAGRPLKALARAGGALALAAMMAAPVVVLLAAQVRDSARGQGFETSVVLAHSVHPFTLLQGLVAGLYGQIGDLVNEWWGQNFFPRGFPYILSLYVGPAALAVAMVGVLTRHTLRTRLVLIALAGVALSMGHWAGLGHVVELLPALRTFRYPVKAFYTVHLAVALLVSLGIAHLHSAERRRAWTLLLAMAATLGGVLAVVPLVPRAAPAAAEGFATAFFPPGLDQPTRALLLSRVLRDAATGGGIALAVATVAALARSGRLRHAALLVVGLMGGDLLRAGSSLNPMVAGTFFEPSPELARSLPGLREGRVFTCPFEMSRGYREERRARAAEHELWTFAVALETLTPPFNAPLRVLTAMSPDLTMLVPPERTLPPGDPACQDLDGLLPRLRRAGVWTLLSIDRLAHPDLRLLGQTQPTRLAPLAVHAYRIADPLPRVEVASEVVLVAGREEGTRLATLPGFLEAGRAAVEDGAASSGIHGRVERARLGNDDVEVTIHASGPTVLVVRDGWARGWRAWVNGAPTPVMRANGRHRGVAVAGGHSTVTMSYRPPGLVAALLVSGLALAVVGGLLRRRRPEPAPGRLPRP